MPQTIKKMGGVPGPAAPHGPARHTSLATGT